MKKGESFRKKPGEEKLKPSFNCVINIPVRFQVSLTPSEKNSFLKLCEEASKKTKRVYAPSTILKKGILDFLKCDNGSDILKKFPNVRQAENELKKQILFSLGLYNSKNNTYFKEILNKKKKEMEKYVK